MVCNSESALEIVQYTPIVAGNVNVIHSVISGIMIDIDFVMLSAEEDEPVFFWSGERILSGFFSASYSFLLLPLIRVVILLDKYVVTAAIIGISHSSDGCARLGVADISNPK